MRAREQFYQDGELARVREEIRRARRMDWVWTGLTVLTLLGLVALGVWLVALIRDGVSTGDNGGNGGWNFGSLFSPLTPVSIPGLALAPVTKGMVGAGFLLLSIAAVCLAVWKNEGAETGRRGDGETKLKQRREFWEQCQWPHDVPAWTVGPLECLSEPAALPLVDPFAECVDGLDGEEMHRILVSVAAEAREVRRLVEWLERQRANISEANVCLALHRATERMDALIRCVEALCGRLCPVISGDEKEPETRRLGDWEMGRRKDSKTAGKPSYAELAAVVIETAVYMRGDSSFDESGRVARIICEAAARLEGGSEV